MARIVVLFRDRAQKEFRVGGDGLRIGRDAENDIRLENPAVSRRHARIYRQEGVFYIEDLKSTNGTSVNDRAVGWKTALNHNDRITIGKHTLVFLEDPDDRDGGKGPRNPEETIIVSPRG